MAVDRPKNPHKELIRVISLWDVPNHHDRHPDVHAISVLRFQRETGETYCVTRVIERRRAAALKAGGSGILHRVMAKAQEEMGQAAPNPEIEFRLYLDGIDWYIELDLPDDEPSNEEMILFPDGDPSELLRDLRDELDAYCDDMPDYEDDIQDTGTQDIGGAK